MRYRGGGRYFGRLRPRRPAPDLSLGTCLLFACGRGRTCGQQDWNQHHERLWSLGETVKALVSTLGTRAAVSFSSDRRVVTRTSRLLRPRLRVSCVFSRPDAPGRHVDCDEATGAENVSYHLADVASDVWLESELTEQNSSIGRGCFFPTPFGNPIVIEARGVDNKDRAHGRPGKVQVSPKHRS